MDVVYLYISVYLFVILNDRHIFYLMRGNVKI